MLGRAVDVLFGASLLFSACQPKRAEESAYSDLLGKCVCVSLDSRVIPCGILEKASSEGLTLVEYGSRVVYPAGRIREVVERKPHANGLPGAEECEPSKR
jgi:hypothetical protein